LQAGERARGGSKLKWMQEDNRKKIKTWKKGQNLNFWLNIGQKRRSEPWAVRKEERCEEEVADRDEGGAVVMEEEGTGVEVLKCVKVTRKLPKNSSDGDSYG